MYSNSSTDYNLRILEEQIQITRNGIWGHIPVSLPYVHYTIMKMKILLSIMAISSYLNLYFSGDWLSIVASLMATVAFVLTFIGDQK